MKMFCEKGVWHITDKGVVKIFNSAYDAWQYVLLMIQIRPLPTVTRSVYPVRTLDPRQAFTKKVMV